MTDAIIVFPSRCGLVGGQLFILIIFFLTFADENNVQKMFYENFQLLISGAKSNRVGAPEFNQPTNHKHGKWQLD